MRFRMTVSESLSHYISDLSKLGDANILGRCVYEGAKIVADEIHSEIGNIPDQSGDWDHRSGLNAPQKAGLYDGLGIAKAQADSFSVNVKIGMDGYNSIKTKRWPNGQPNAMIARSIEGGTYFLEAHPFIGPAVRKSRAAAEKAISDQYDIEVKKIMGGNS